MRALRGEFAKASVDPTISHGTRSSSGKRRKTTRDCPRLTIRFSPEDYERLQSLADGMTLSVYIRAKALGDDLSGRKRRSSASVANKADVAEILGLLGQSRIANNLNQLAHQANVGTLVVEEQTRSQIEDAYRSILVIRTLLLKALGQRG